MTTSSVTREGGASKRRLGARALASLRRLLCCSEAHGPRTSSPVVPPSSSSRLLTRCNAIRRGAASTLRALKALEARPAQADPQQQQQQLTGTWQAKALGTTSRGSNTSTLSTQSSRPMLSRAGSSPATRSKPSLVTSKASLVTSSQPCEANHRVASTAL